MRRTNFNRSKLIRSLSGLSLADVAESNQSVAERLGQWFDVTDAMTLFAALSPTPGRSTAALAEAAPAQAVTVQEELARVKKALLDSINGCDRSKRGSKALALPQPTQDAPAETLVDFLPYHRYYLAHQRNMASGIGPLRTRAREALSRCSPKLKQLAELDAALDQAMGNRERDLLATVPSLLEKHFNKLRIEHQGAPVETQKSEDPGERLQSGGWLALFCRDMQDVLLAELDVRLQPVEGLIEAYDKEATRHQ